MVTILLAINFLLMLILPIILGGWIAAKRKVRWGLFAIGAVTFILSQVGHIPFNWLILQQLELIDSSSLIVLAIFLGLSAGVFEEVGRYLAYRFWAKDARTWGKGLMLGAGHGGVEAILIGAVGLINFVVLLGLKNGYFAGLLASVPEDQLVLVDQQIEAMFGVPASMALLGAVERVFALMLHLAASLMVMQVFLRGQLRWLGFAILWHAVINATAVVAVSTWGAIPTEIALGVLSLVSLGIIFWLHSPEPVAEALEPMPPLEPLRPIETTADSLERSRYSG